jgi:GAF domain-containing protein
MAEDLSIIKGTREEKYQSLIPQIKALVEFESNETANLSNVAAALKYGMDFFWVGFYLKEKEELVLGPFQGPPACTRIRKGKGVCGSSWEKNEIMIVEDVDKFPGHIACSSLSKSEIVIPIYKEGKFYGVLDVDSDKLSDFNEVDKKHLKTICELIFPA